MKKLYWLILIILLAILIYFFFIKNDSYNVSSDGFLHYPQNRETPEINSKLIEENENWFKYKITFPSKNILLHAFLYQPKKEGKLSAVVLLAGGGKAKEDVEYESQLLANQSMVVLSLDQRGVGETGGNFPGIEQDFQTFLKGEEPNLHLVIYDVLVSFDVLKSLNYVDENKISVMGESQGGRFALIAGAVEKRFEKVIVIAGAGFGFSQQKSPEMQRFFNSINPDFYASKISPRKLLMLHSLKDELVPFSSARATFNLAKEPKEFYEIEDCRHGYCKEMDKIILKQFQ